jgi:putative phosphoesterase
MRIALTSDLHLDSTQANRALVPHLARAIATHAPDVLVVAGDVSAHDDRLRGCLETLRPAAPVCVFVPGNHDVWVARSAQAAGATSNQKHDDAIARACADAGFTHLGLAPLVVGDVGFAGTIGWYDYTFTHPRFAFTREEYTRKMRGKHRWMDRYYARWVNGVAPERMSDPDVTALRVSELRAQLAALDAEGAVREVVVVSHHLPFDEVLREPQEPVHAYFRAYLGSRALGAAVRESAKARTVCAGHIHRPVDQVVDERFRVCGSPVGYLRPAPDDLAATAGASVRIVEL